MAAVTIMSHIAAVRPETSLVKEDNQKGAAEGASEGGPTPPPPCTRESTFWVLRAHGQVFG